MPNSKNVAMQQRVLPWRRHNNAFSTLPTANELNTNRNLIKHKTKTKRTKQKQTNNKTKQTRKKKEMYAVCGTQRTVTCLFLVEKTHKGRQTQSTIICRWLR
jgi:hypothetical protein